MEQGRCDSIQLWRAGDVPIPAEDLMGWKCHEEQLFWYQEHHRKHLEAAAALPTPAKHESCTGNELQLTERRISLLQ